MYQKEIIYLHLFDGEIKGSCAGYLKMEKKENRYALELQVRKLPQEITGSFPIRLQSESGWREEDALAVEGGDGKWLGTCEEQILHVEVIVSPARKIKGQSKSCEMPDKRQNTTLLMEEKENPDSEKTTEIADREKNTIPIPIMSEKMPVDSGKSIVAAEKECAVRTEHTTRSERPVRTEHTARTEHASRVERMPLYENKWEQLLSTYEQIHPYGDDRIYVKLEPKDFIILRENYQHLVNNSFLLHGFYNYRYLILGKEGAFYLGVPGVFYEREKMVALMFGFEAFECEGGNAEEGKFGYYLRKVEL